MLTPFDKEMTNEEQEQYGTLIATIAQPVMPYIIKTNDNGKNALIAAIMSAYLIGMEDAIRQKEQGKI